MPLPASGIYFRLPTPKDGEAKVVSSHRLLWQLAARRALRDFLDNPSVAVGILKGNVGGIAFALRIRATDPRLRGEGRAMEDLGGLDTAGHDMFVSRHDIGNDQPGTERAWLGVRNSFANRDRGS